MMNPISSSKTFIQSSKSKNRILPRLIPAATSTNAPVAFFTSLLNPKANLEQKKEEVSIYLSPLYFALLPLVLSSTITIALTIVSLTPPLLIITAP
jgi:hypothetical protein